MAVTVTKGKTHTQYCRILLDGVNLSGDARQIQSTGLAHNPIEATDWLETIHTYYPDRATLNFGPFQALLRERDSATGPTEEGSWTHLKDQDISIGTFAIGIQEAPTIGCPMFSADLEHFVTISDVADGMVPIRGEFAGVDGGRAGWGQALAVGTSISATTSNGSLDNGAGTTNGFVAFLHVTQSAGAMGTNNWAFKLEHSTDDGSWSNLTTAFTLDGSAVGAEKVSATGTVNQYVRATATKTAGTDVVYWLNFIRL